MIIKNRQLSCKLINSFKVHTIARYDIKPNKSTKFQIKI